MSASKTSENPETSSLPEKVAAAARFLARLFLDSLFPIRCLGCKQAPCWLCEECFQRIPRLMPSSILFDRQAEPRRALDGLISAVPFRTPIVSRLIHCYKYAFVEDLRQPLGALMSEALLRTSLPLPHIITFVPLHPRRLRQRGFNQAECLAQELTAALNAPMPLFTVTALLERTRFTKPQIQTASREERLKNLTGAFRLGPHASALKRKTIWLVDDVATTYSTLEECAKILKAAGAKEVYGVTIAR